MKIPVAFTMGLLGGIAMGWLIFGIVLSRSRKDKAAVCMYVLCTAFAFLAVLPLAGLTKGMTWQMTGEISYVDTLRYTTAAPTPARSIPDRPDRGGRLYIVYRFNCDACVAAGPEIDRVLGEYGVNDVTYLSSRTSPGKEFVDEYKIAAVPSAVYIDRDRPDIYFVEKLYPNNRFNQDGLEFLIRKYQDQSPDNSQ